MARQGATAVGVEPGSDLMLNAARQVSEAPALVAGRGELLPFAGTSFDAVVFLNSLHHVGTDALASTLAETRRVLRPGGSLIVIEPAAEGDYFELLRPVEDETEIREEAQRALARAAALPAWQEKAAGRYATVVTAASADTVCERFLAADPARAPAVAAKRDEIEHLFATLGERDEGGGRRFLQPFRLRQLVRTAGTELVIEEVRSPSALRACFALRKAVFVDEQGVPPASEFDEHEARSTHLLALFDGEPVGTLRWRPYGADLVKVERVAVARHRRGARIGRALMLACLAHLDGLVKETVLSAQVQAQAFYERLGYHVKGQPFMEDGILHIRMRRQRPL
jgi:predicted GNAT family N-acyltransferase/SAM-dependent methyltransferase